MHLVENKIPRDWLCSQAIMASPSGKGAQAQEAPGCGPQPLARDLVDSVDDAEGLYVAVERCPLCNTTRRRLTCAKCVQSGDFVYFDGRDRERFIDKKERLSQLKSKQEEFQKEVLRAMEGKWMTDQLRWKIMSCKMRIEQLKQTICKGNEEMKKNTEGLLKTKEKNQKLYTRAQRHQEKKEKIQRHNRKLGDLVEKKNMDLRSHYERLADLRRSHILELTSVIFPIEEVKTGASEFCGENLSRQKFTRAVKKLNANILYLCFSQHVNLDQLQPLHTLRNLMYLVSPNSEHLGRSGPFEVRADLEESMEFVDPGVAGESDESGDEHVSDEETDLGTDWENLPSPRFCDIPSQPVEVSQSQSSQASPPIASSSAGGMISSAAASVTSWFKAYTGHR
ncbi:hypothetical protein G4228_008600 [Cervus hanglu yarkandensis]|nr:hypothetical protein G4228_008600 [Cervus hanglu yarkandensis]